MVAGGWSVARVAAFGSARRETAAVTSGVSGGRTAVVVGVAELGGGWRLASTAAPPAESPA